VSEEVVERQESVSESESESGVTRKLGTGAGAATPRPRRAETRKLEPEADMETALEVVAPSPHLGLTREETTWAALAQASILLTFLLAVFTGGIAAFLGPIVPAVIWYVHRDRSEYVAEQARQATIFQLAGILGLLVLAIVGAVLVAVGWAVSAVLVVVLIGLILLPVMLIVTLVWVAAVIALPIVMVVYGCYAALEAYNGRPFRYLWVADLIDRYQTQA
jgi:uncharacterized Tic20 family protein